MVCHAAGALVVEQREFDEKFFILFVPDDLDRHLHHQGIARHSSLVALFFMSAFVIVLVITQQLGGFGGLERPRIHIIRQFVFHSGEAMVAQMRLG